MRKILSALIITLICLVLFILSVFIIAKIKLTPETIEKTLNQTAQNYFGREVSVNSIDINFSGDISLIDINTKTISDIEKTPLFTAEKIIVTPRLLPVLFNRFIVKKLEIKNPAISSNLLNGLTTVSHSVFNPGSMKVLFIPDKLIINGGRIFYGNDTDATLFENISLNAPDISFIFPFNVQMYAGLPDSEKNDLAGEFRISIPGRYARGEVLCEEIPVSIFKEFFKDSSFEFEDGLFSLSSKVVFEQLRTLKLRGTAGINDFALTHDRGVQLKDLDLSFNFESETDIQTKESLFSNIRGDFLSQPFSGKGELKNTAAGNLINFSFQSDRFSLSSVLESIAYTPWANLEEIALRGPVEISALFKGVLGSSISPTVLINFLDNQINYPPLGRLQPSLKGIVNITDRKIFIDNLEIGAKGISLVFYGDIYNYNMWPPEVQVKVVSSRINFSELFPDREIFDDEDIGPFDLMGFTAGGPINLGNVSFLGIPIHRLQGSYQIKDNIFSIKDLTGSIGEGYFRLSLDCDLGVRGLDYHTHLRLHNTPVDKLFNIIYPGLRNFVEGDLTGNFALKGDGTTLFRFKENLKADGIFSITNGLIKNISFPAPVPSIIKTSELQQIPLTAANINLRFRKGLLNLDAALLSPKAELYPAGVISLDSWLKINARARVLPEIFIGMGDLAKYLPVENNMVALSFDIEGDLMKPRISLDRKSLDYIIQETLPGIFRDMLSSRQEDIPEDMLDDLIERMKDETEPD